MNKRQIVIIYLWLSNPWIKGEKQFDSHSRSQIVRLTSTETLQKFMNKIQAGSIIVQL